MNEVLRRRIGIAANCKYYVWDRRRRSWFSCYSDFNVHNYMCLLLLRFRFYRECFVRFSVDFPFLFALPSVNSSIFAWCDIYCLVYSRRAWLLIRVFVECTHYTDVCTCALECRIYGCIEQKFEWIAAGFLPYSLQPQFNMIVRPKWNFPDHHHIKGVFAISSGGAESLIFKVVPSQF